MRFWKIIATLWPALNSKKTLNKCIENVEAFRLNMSHVDKPETEALIQYIRNTGHNKAFLLDTKWPEIRTRIKEKLNIEADDSIVISRNYDKIQSKFPVVGTSYEFTKDIPIDTEVSFDDDKVVWIISRKSGKWLAVKITEWGTIWINKTVNFKWYDPNIDFLTKQDLIDIEWGVKMNISIIAASFVKNHKDIKKLRKILKKHKSPNTKIIAKIETVSALEDIEKIIQVSDGIMVARWDLGATTSIIELPKIQKNIIELCNKYGKPVILATQLLSSMVNNSKPSRAEVDEIVYSINSGVDTFMLSDETAIWKFPIKTLEYLNNIIINYQDESIKNYSWKDLKDIKTNETNDYILIKAMEISKEIDIKLIICPTETGRTTSRISALKPKCPIFSFTKSNKVFRFCSIMRWVRSFKVWDDISYENIKRIAKWLIEIELKWNIAMDDKVLIVHSSVAQNSAGMINGIEIVKYKYLY